MSSYSGQIQNVPVFPDVADTLTADSFYGFPPSYRWVLSKTITNPDKTTSLQMLTQGNDSFSTEQWNTWVNQPDTYALQVAATNLGVKLL